MAITTTAQQVRSIVADVPKRHIHEWLGDGSGSSFIVPHENITSAVVEVIGTNSQWSAAANAAIDISGYVTLSDVQSANSGIRGVYVWSVWSEDEIGYYITAGGTVLGAATNVLRSLMFDTAKRSRWASPDGTQYDDTQIIFAIERMYKALKDEHEQEDGVSGGGFNEWAIEQESV